MLLWVRHAQSQANYFYWLLLQERPALERMLRTAIINGTDEQLVPACRDAFERLQAGHETHVYPLADPALMPIGVRQCAETGRALARFLAENNTSIDTVVVSPMTRTRETAVHVLTETGFRGELVLDPLVKEINHGDISDRGTPRSQLLRSLGGGGALPSGWSADVSLLEEEEWWGGHESEEFTQGRIHAFHARYRDVIESEDRLLVCFSHGGIIRRHTGVIPDNCAAILERPGREPELLVPGHPHLGFDCDPCPDAIDALLPRLEP